MTADYEATLAYAQRASRAQRRGLIRGYRRGRFTRAFCINEARYQRATLYWLRSASLLFGRRPAAGFRFYDLSYRPPFPIRRTLGHAITTTRLRNRWLQRRCEQGLIDESHCDTYRAFNHAIVEYLAVLDPTDW